MNEQETDSIPFELLREKLTRRELFADKSWKLAPAPFAIPAPMWQELELIGEACLAFHQALETLYLRARDGKSLLRNQDLRADWVAELLDRGKPADLLQHSASSKRKGTFAPVLRPDLLWTDNGWVLTELDSVPGGLGLTLYLQKIYETKFGGFGGSFETFLERFWTTLVPTGSNEKGRSVAFVLREEGMTYFPEFEYLAEALQYRGHRTYAMRAEELIPLGHSLHVNVDGNPEKIDLIYRFFELFDLQNMDNRSDLLNAIEQGEIGLTPPMRPFQEEKLALALFHHHRLTEFWKQEIPGKLHRCLQKLIPRTWVLEEADLPPGAVWMGPEIGGRPIWDWMQLADGSQKERQLILKRSGFSPDSWGARSVLLGNDVSREEWRAGLKNALAEAGTSPFIIQEYHKPKRVPFTIYDDEGISRKIDSRVRICPYYFCNGKKVQAGPVLATVCPADKKIIHGMSVASMVPAYCQPEG